MTLPSPFFAANQIKCPLQPQPKVSRFYRDPQQQQPVETKREFISYCKFCKEGFASNTELAQHRRNHVKCPYDECKFNANEATVAAHIQRTHLKQNSIVKIQDLTTPEQVEKWREERRKRYPTTQNVILRQRLQEEKFKRGERLHESKSRFGDKKQRDLAKKPQNCHDKVVKNGDKMSRNRNNLKGRGKRLKEKNHRPQPNDNFKKPQEVRPPPPAVSSDEDEVQQRSTPRFTGTSKMNDYHTVETVVKERPALSILGMYGSDSDSEDVEEDSLREEKNDEKDSLREEKNDEIVSHTTSTTSSEISRVEPMSSNESIEEEVAAIENDADEDDDNDEAPDEIQNVKPSINEPDVASSDCPKSRKRKRQSHKRDIATKTYRKPAGLDYSKMKKVGNLFLEKLLQRDIVHERNVLLQCVSFVVRNNFFGVGQSGNTQKEDDAFKN